MRGVNAEHYCVAVSSLQEVTGIEWIIATCFVRTFHSTGDKNESILVCGSGTIN